MLCFNVPIEKFRNEEEIYGVKSILKSVINKKLANLLKEYVTDLEIIKTDSEIFFIPLNEKKEKYEFATSILWNIYSTIKVDFIGYTLLSDNELAEYIVKDIGMTNVKYINNIAIITIESAREMYVNENIDFRIQNYKGYFVYNINSEWEKKYIEQLCIMYEIGIQEKNDRVWILKTDMDFMDFIVKPETWIRRNVERIRNGMYPNIHISTNTRENKKLYVNNYDNINGEPIYYKYVLKYCALLAFAELAEKCKKIGKYISHEIYNVDIKLDNSISVNLPSKKLYNEYRDIFWDLYLSDRKYRFEFCSNYVEGIIKRYIIQNKDKNAYPILFSLGKVKNIIIFTGLTGLEKYDLSRENVEKNREILKEKIVATQKTQTCHDRYETIEMEDLSNLSLEDVSSLIAITENNITYCFTKKNIEKMSQNPVTRKPLSDKILYEIQHIDYGLRGIYNVSILDGLFSEIPYPNIFIESIDSIDNIKSLNKSIIKITRVSNQTKTETDLLGNVFLVQALISYNKENINNEEIKEENKDNMNKENIIQVYDLFEIALPKVDLQNIDRLKQYVNILWNKGFFLDDWQKFIYSENLNVIIMPNINNSNLVDAKNSMHDGLKCLDYLENLVQL